MSKLNLEFSNGNVGKVYESVLLLLKSGVDVTISSDEMDFSHIKNELVLSEINSDEIKVTKKELLCGNFSNELKVLIEEAINNISNYQGKLTVVNN